MPLLFVAGVVGALIALHLASDGGNLTGLILFGRSFAASTHPPAGALVGSPYGYDGQFFYVQALDPLLLHPATASALKLAGAAFRLQRMGYPLVAFVLAGGQASAVPVSLLAVNVLMLCGGCLAAALYTHHRGWSTAWAVALTLMPGMLLPTLRDLSDPLATVSVVTGILLVSHQRRWSAAAALTAAVLTREVMMLAVISVALHHAACAWTYRRDRRWRAELAQTWPPVVIPAAAFMAWQAYITIRVGGPVGSPAASLPLWNLVQEIRWSLSSGLPLYGGWDTVYVALIVVAAVVAAVSAVRRRSLLAAAALATSLGVLIPTLGDSWGDTRLSAPLFALLLLDGLHRDDRLAIGVCGAAAAMSLLAPFAIPGLL